MNRIELRPGVPTRIPGTRVEVRWDGDREVSVHLRGGVWDLSPLARPDRVLAWERLADHPQLGWWPVLTPISYQKGRSVTATESDAKRQR